MPQIQNVRLQSTAIDPRQSLGHVQSRPASPAMFASFLSSYFELNSQAGPAPLRTFAINTKKARSHISDVIELAPGSGGWLPSYDYKQLLTNDCSLDLSGRESAFKRNTQNAHLPP